MPVGSIRWQWTQKKLVERNFGSYGNVAGPGSIRDTFKGKSNKRIAAARILFTVFLASIK